MSQALNLSLDKLFRVTFLKSLFLGFSIKNTSFKFAQKNWWSYAVLHCTSGEDNKGRVNASEQGHVVECGRFRG